MHARATPQGLATGGLVQGPRAAWRQVGREVASFGAVGAVAYLVDAGLFNLLAFGLPHGLPSVAAKTVSVAVATVVTWLGNRHFVFAHRRGRDTAREAALFFAFSLAGMVIAVGTLWVSHDLLGFTSPAADNVAGNVVGFGLATLFRFVTYRTFVFRPPSGAQAAQSGGRTTSEASN